MSDIWREELEQIAGAHGLPAEALEDWFALREPEAEGSGGSTLAARLSNYLDDLAVIVAEAAAGSSTALNVARQTAADLIPLALLFGAPGLGEWAEGVDRKNGHLRLSREAAALLTAVAAALRKADDLHPLRERDGEWGNLPLAVIPEAETQPTAASLESRESPVAEGPQATATESEPTAYQMPASEVAPETEHVPAHSTPAAPSRRVLVMGPPCIGREFLIRQLKEAQLCVEAADNPFEAETALARQHYDIVFVDPGVSGDIRRLAGRPELAKRMVLLREGSGVLQPPGLESIGQAVSMPPSMEELEALLNRYL
jgi:hypothetical protein